MGFKHIQASSVREKSKKSDLKALNIRKILKVCYPAYKSFPWPWQGKRL